MRCGNCGEVIDKDMEFCGGCGNKINWLEMEALDKKRNPLLIAGIAVAGVGVVVAAVFAASKLSGGVDKQLFYAKEDALYYVKDASKKSEPIEVSEIDNDTEDVIPYISVGEKYLYFSSEIDKDGNRNLVRLPISKIKKNPSKTEKYIEEIESRIVDYSILKNEKELLYKDNKNRLYYFDGKTDKEIERNVSSYTYVKDEDLVIYKTSADNDSELCIYDLKSSDDIDIDDEVSEFFYDSKKIYYRKSDSKDLFVSDLKGNTDELEDDVATYRITNEGMYIIKEHTIDKKLYDLVTDSCENDDNNIATEGIKALFKEVTAKEAMGSEDYNYYVLRNPDEFYEYLDYEASYDSDAEMYCVYNDDVCYCFDEDSEKWYKGNMEEYYAAIERIDLRESLKEENITTTEYELYYQKNGGNTELVADNLSCYSFDGDGILYCKSEDNGKKVVDIKEISYASDVLNYIEISSDNLSFPITESEYYVSINGKEALLGSKEQVSEFQLTGDENLLAVQFADEIEIYASASGGQEFKFVDTVSREGNLSGADDDTVYYFDDYDSDKMEGDFYGYTGKEPKLIAESVHRVYIYDDGNVLYEEDFENPTLKMLTGKNKEAEIGDEINTFSYIYKNCIVYTTYDQDLYVFVKEDKDWRVDRDVISYRCDSQSYTY